MRRKRIATLIISILLVFMAGLVKAGSDSASMWRGKIESFYDYDRTQPLEESFALLHNNQWYLHYDVSYKS